MTADDVVFGARAGGCALVLFSNRKISLRTEETIEKERKKTGNGIREPKGKERTEKRHAYNNPLRALESLSTQDTVRQLSGPDRNGRQGAGSRMLPYGVS
jgi:hypothetical protein